jgi:Zn-dependent M28 family amino/carboxypeptidase
MAAAGHTLAELVDAAESRDFRPVATGVRARAHVRSDVHEVHTANVVGLLPGSDPARANEPVLLSSHYDHLGTRLGEHGATLVYHGAYDNASGVALLLSMAEAAAAMPERFRARSSSSPRRGGVGLLGASGTRATRSFRSPRRPRR